MEHAISARIVFWAPPGYPFPEEYAAGLSAYLQRLAFADGLSSNVTSVIRQYVDPDGMALSSLASESPLTVTSAYPVSGCPAESEEVCLTSAQLEEELAALIGGGELSAGIGHTYLLLTPPRVKVCFDNAGESCSGTEFCAYHSWLASPTISRTTYGVVPFHGPGCQTAIEGPHQPSLDAAISSTTHELMEVATDPLPPFGYVDKNGNEIADECAWQFGPTQEDMNEDQFNQLLSGEEYLVQQMWSDLNQECVLGLDETGLPAVASGPALVDAGVPATYVAQMQGDPEPAETYEWWYAKAWGSPVYAGTGQSAVIALPAPGEYTVWADIVDASGGSVVAATRSIVPEPPTAAFSYYSEGTVGSPLRFDGSSSYSRNGSIGSWLWRFGDGATASGATVTHAFARPGDYHVALTVTDTVGASASAEVTVVIAPKAEGGVSAFRRSVHTKRRRRHHGWELTVRGSGFPAGRIVVVFGYHRRRWRLHVRVGARGSFVVMSTFRVPARLIAVRGS